MKSNLNQFRLCTWLFLTDVISLPIFAQPTPTVEVISVKRGSISRHIELPATLAAFEESELFSKASGYVQEVSADIGDHMKTGQVLAVLDVPELKADLLEAKAVLTARQKSLEASDATVEQSKKLLEISQKTADRYRAEYSLQQVTLKRLEALAEAKAATDQQMDDARTKTEVAKAELAVAEAKVAGSEADVKAAMANREVAAAQVDVAGAQLQKVNALLEYTKITAPFDGVITRRSVNRGDLMQSAVTSRGMSLFTIQKTDQIRVFCEVPENEVSYINIGDYASVAPYGSAVKAVEGKITRFSPMLNATTRTMRVEVDLPNPTEKLLAGMYAQVVFECAKKENVITVPLSAVVNDGKADAVYVVASDQVVKTPVKTGLSDGTKVEIVEGLSEEAKVIATAKTAPAAGTTVKSTSKP